MRSQAMTGDEMTQFQQRWQSLAPAQRTAIMAVGAVDIGLRIWALADLAGRPAAQVRGPKTIWAVGLSVVSSAGVLPATYLIVGRRRA
jgi:hypothetical protein